MNGQVRILSKRKGEIQMSNEKKGLSKALKLFYGIGDCGFTLMTNVESYYFNFFLTNLAQFGLATVSFITTTASSEMCIRDRDIWSHLKQYQTEKMGPLPFLADSSAMAGTVSLCIPVSEDRRRASFHSDHHRGCCCQPCCMELPLCGQCIHDRGSRQNTG